jgi:hypothetical protein
MAALASTLAVRRTSFLGRVEPLADGTASTDSSRPTGTLRECLLTGRPTRSSLSKLRDTCLLIEHVFQDAFGFLARTALPALLLVGLLLLRSFFLALGLRGFVFSRQQAAIESTHMDLLYAAQGGRGDSPMASSVSLSAAAVAAGVR